MVSLLYCGSGWNGNEGHATLEKGEESEISTTPMMPTKEDMYFTDNFKVEREQ